MVHFYCKVVYVFRCTPSFCVKLQTKHRTWTWVGLFNKSINLHIVCREAFKKKKEKRKNRPIYPLDTDTQSHESGFMHIPILNYSQRMHSLFLILCTTPLKSVIQILALHFQNIAMDTPPSLTVTSGMQYHKQLRSLMPVHNEENISATDPNAGCYPIIHSCCFFYPWSFPFLY